MYVRPLIVFKTPFYEPRYKQFRNPSELQKFLTVFDFMRPHMCSRLQTGMPEFQLGTKLEFTIDGYFCESDVKWGPRFIVARAVTNNQGRIFADIPTDGRVATATVCWLRANTNWCKYIAIWRTQ